MVSIKTVLCPVDFSDQSRHALSHAVQIARWFESRLSVLHVYPLLVAPPPVVFGGLPGPLPPVEPYAALAASPERAHEDALSRLTTFTAGFEAPGITVTLSARPGPPASVILDESHRLQSDLVVLGTHGHSGFERWMLGSVTEKVLRKSTCPVLTIPPPVQDAPRDPVKMFNRILCAVDFSEASLAGLEYALALAKEADAELLLMHVIDGLPDSPNWEQPHGPAVVEYLRLSEEKALSRLRQALPDEARTWCRPHIILGTGTPYREILRTAVERDAHLIVMGVHGRSVVDRLFFGSTANHVVRAASCPVLTLKAKRG